MSSLKKKERVKNKTNKKNLDKGNTREAPLAYLHQPSCLLSIHSPQRVATAPQSARSADLSPHQLQCTPASCAVRLIYESFTWYYLERASRFTLKKPA